MSALSLKIIADGCDITQMTEFEPGTRVANAYPIIKEKVHHIEDEADYGLSADDNLLGAWLQPHRTYMLRDGDSLLLIKRSRIFRGRMLDSPKKDIQTQTENVEKTEKNEEVYREANLLDLSDDVLLCILQYLSPHDLKALGFSCVRLGSLVLDGSLWTRVDARGSPCGYHRTRWLLQALHSATTDFHLTGLAALTSGCMGYVNRTRREVEDEEEAMRPKPEPEYDGDYRNRELYEQAFANVPGGGEDLNNQPPGNEAADNRLVRQHARMHINPQPMFDLPRITTYPSWPDDCELLKVDPKDKNESLDSDGCPGPQFTLTGGMLRALRDTCPRLTALSLEYCNINCKKWRISMFSPTIRWLSLKGTRCYNLPNLPMNESFLFKIHDYLPRLEHLDLSECEWLEPESLLLLSKIPTLTSLLLKDCIGMTEFVAHYASLATMYGFRWLRKLDFRGCRVGDSGVSALGWLPELRELYLSPPVAKAPTVTHRHYRNEPVPRHCDLHDWEKLSSLEVQLSSEARLWGAGAVAGTGAVADAAAGDASRVTTHTPASRKVQPKRSGLGARKGGLGATKVAANFDDIEREAIMAEKLKLEAASQGGGGGGGGGGVDVSALAAEAASLRLAYTHPGHDNDKPAKHRLGIAATGGRHAQGISHSAAADMTSIEQEGADRPRTHHDDNDMDDFSMIRNEPFGRGVDSLITPRGGLSSSWENIEPEAPRNVRTMFSGVEPQASAPSASRAPAPTARKARRPEPVEDDSAVKKFGSAKAISSAQFFGEQESNWERDSNLSRFQGSSAISSAEYFGNDRQQHNNHQGFTVNAPDLDEVRESVRMGVTRVAGRLSSLANGVVSSLQERYGY